MSVNIKSEDHAEQVDGMARRPLRSTAKAALRGARQLRDKLVMPVRIARGRALLLDPLYRGFRGAYSSYDEAIAAIPSHRPSGYNHGTIANVCFDSMSKVAPWDYPVMFWLQRLLPDATLVLDAGGHMGTKYRAFRGLLDLAPPLHWVVYDLPEIIREGRSRADEEGLRGLAFTDDPGSVGPADIMVASGLLQYLDVPFTDLMKTLAAMPPHLILNKVAVRDGDTKVTLERIGDALVPYQIRCRTTFFLELEQLGYDVVDEWTIPELSHVIPTHPELGRSQSIGCYLARAPRASD